MQIINIVDSLAYVQSNCFQHQLYETLSTNVFVKTVELNEFLRSKPKADGYISTLKLRTLATHIEPIATIIGNKKLSVYDQDPWESFRDDGPWKGSYSKIAQLTYATFFVTSRYWADWISKKGLRCHFVPMWVLPKYCIQPSQIEFNNRPIEVGFIGQIHPYRKELFDHLKSKNIHVTTLPSKSSYQEFLTALRTMKIFIHAETLPLMCDGEPMNLENGLFIKDIEAISQGCYSIRNYGSTYEDYLSEVKTFRFYSSIDEVPSIIEDVLLEHSSYSDVSEIIESVRSISTNNRWKETCQTLIWGCTRQ